MTENTVLAKISCSGTHASVGVLIGATILETTLGSIMARHMHTRPSKFTPRSHPTEMHTYVHQKTHYQMS